MDQNSSPQPFDVRPYDEWTIEECENITTGELVITLLGLYNEQSLALFRAPNFGLRHTLNARTFKVEKNCK